MIERVLAARSIVLIAFLLAILVLALGVRGLTIDPNNRVFFGSGHTHYANLMDLEARFGSSSTLLLVIQSDLNVFEAPRLRSAIVWLTNAASRIDGVMSVESVASYPKVLGSGDDLAVTDLLSHVCPENSCDPARRDQLSDPVLVGRLVNGEATAFAVAAKVDLFEPAPQDVTRIEREARALAVEFTELYPEFDLLITGGVPMMQAFYDAAKADSSFLLVLAVCILFVLLFIFLGGLVPTLIMGVLGASSVVASMGLAGWLGWIVNTATATVPLIVFTLVVAAGMHIFLHIVREPGLETHSLVLRSVQAAVYSNFRPVILTGLTTSVGLLSMVFVSAPPLRELGILAAFGVAFGAVASVTLVPCLFSYSSALRPSRQLLRVQALMNRYAKWTESRRPSVWLISVFLLVCLAGIPWLNVDEDFVRYFAGDTQFREQTEAITPTLSGPYHLDLVYDSTEPLGIYEPESIDTLRGITRFLRGHPDVVNVLSIADVLENVSEVLAGHRDLKQLSAPDLAQFFLSYELSLGWGQSTQDLLDSDQRMARISVLLGDVSMREIRELAEDISEWAENAGVADRLTITGEGMPTAHLSSESIYEMSLGILLSMLISSLLVGLYFKNVKVCLLVLSATVVPILAGFGIWGWFVSDIGMAATLVVAITIGVVVDDTIHLTYRYLDGLRNLDLTPWGAAAYSIHKTGTALVVTSVALIAGLSVLVFSQFRMNSTFGVCASMIVLLALLYNVVFAPRMLRRISR